MAPADAVSGFEAGDSGLRANGFVAKFEITRDIGDGFFNVRTAGMAVNQNGIAGGTTEELVERNVERFRFDVPESSVDSGNRGHGDGTAAPISTFVEILPDILDLAGIAADQKRKNVIVEIAGDGKFAPVEGGVAQTVEAVFGGEFNRDEIAARRTDDNFGVGNLHWANLLR